jgi:psp operon transcriptional activator
LSEPIHDIRFNVFPATQPAQRPQAEPETSKPIAPAELETTDFTDRVMTFERNLIDQALGRHDHHQGKAAEYLGLSYHQFRGLLRKHGMKK